MNKKRLFESHPDIKDETLELRAIEEKSSTNGMI